VSILIRKDLPNLRWQLLPPPPSLIQDPNTETIRLRLHWSHPGEHSIIDLINVYRPPISCNPTDIRTDQFDINQFTLPIHENESLRTASSIEHNDVATPRHCIPTTVGTILCGDFNAHHKSWDWLSRPDAHGNKIFKFARCHNLKIANTGTPTCYLKNKHPTAIDLTLFRGSIAVSDWSADHPPLGKSPHRILSYTINPLPAFPLQYFTLEDDIHQRVSYSWKKANWQKFNNIADGILSLARNQPSPHKTAKVLRKAFTIAA
jgi:hypothetical protein